MKILLPCLLLFFILAGNIYGEDDFPPYVALDLPDRYVLIFSNKDASGKSLSMDFSIEEGSKYPVSCKICHATKIVKEGVTQDGAKMVSTSSTGPIRMLILSSPTDAKHTWHLPIGEDTVIGIPKVETSKEENDKLLKESEKNKEKLRDFFKTDPFIHFIPTSDFLASIKKETNASRKTAMLLEIGDTDEALKTLSNSKDGQEEKSIGLYAAIDQEFIRENEYDKSFAMGKRLKELFPRNLDVVTHLIFLYNKIKKFNEGVPLIEDTQKNIDQFKYNTSSLFVFYLNSGEIYTNCKKPDEALFYLEKAAKINDKDPGVNYLLNFNHTLKKDFDKPAKINITNQGMRHATQEEYDSAIVEYTKAIEINPKDARAYSNRGFNYQKTGSLDQAISDYTKSLEINPEDAVVYYVRGCAYYEKGDFDRAIADCSKGIEIKPRYAPIYFERGLAYQKKGNIDAAIADYSKVIEIDPTDVSAYGNRGNAYGRKGKYDEAVADFNKAIEIAPNSGRGYWNRAIAYFQKKEYDKAWADTHRAEALGYKGKPGLIELLKKASGREK